MIYHLPRMPRQQNENLGFKKKVVSKDGVLAQDKASSHCLIRHQPL